MFKMIIAQKDLVYNLVMNDIRGRYLGSFVGLLGTVINPILLLVIYSFVFSAILKIKFGLSGGMGNFAIYLFCGLLPWLAFSEAVQRSSTVLLDQRALIKRVRFTKEILSFYLTLSSFISQMIGLLVFLIILFFIGSSLGGYVLLLIFIFPLQILFTFGFCLLISSLNVFFRDIGIFLGTLLQVWFFCTPVFYPESVIPIRFMPFMELNPMLHLVRIYREIVLQNSMPEMHSIAYFSIASFVILLIGGFIFNRIKDKIVDYL